jgi:hypothetical protein
VLSSYLASDALSGLVDPETGDFTFTVEGENQSHTFTVTDKAGNTNSATVEDINIDLTVPVITAGTPTGTKDSSGEWVSAITVPFSATDSLSGLVPSGAKSADLDSKTTPDQGSDLFVTSDGISDLAGNFAPGISSGPFSIFVPMQPTEEFPVLSNDLKKIRVYYEILNPHRFVSVEPATPTTYYAYHPLTPTDSSAFDKIKLDMNAYEFISKNINLKKSLAPYFGE